jgi:sporulation protein, ylmC/ymxH family
LIERKGGIKVKDSIMTLSDIEEKDVINVVTGERIGFVSSLKIDTNSGQIIAITVQPSMRFMSFFSKDDEAVVVPWNQILKIGEDVIIVNVTQSITQY